MTIIASAIFDYVLLLKTEVPSRVDHAVLGYSHYKKGFTIKVLVCTAPCGIIQFISVGFGGRATDGQITIQSGFIYYMKYGMKILADKVAFYSQGFSNHGIFKVMLYSLD